MITSDQEDTEELVTAVIDRQLFGFPIRRVRDIFIPAQLTRVPLAPTEIAGILNLRGRVVTVVSMRRYLGLPDRADGGVDMAIGIELGGEIYALLIDSVGEVLRVSDSIRVANPVNLDRRIADMAAGIYRLEDGLLIVLNVDRVLDLGGPARAA